jgi:transposase
MDTSVFVESPGRRTNRRHGAEFKAQVVLACRQPGVSIAAVALANGLNANMLRRWMIEAGRVDPPAAAHGQRAVAKSATTLASSCPSFVAVQMPAPPEAPKEADIHIELTRGPTTIVMRWPASVAGACATWLREMLR